MIYYPKSLTNPRFSLTHPPKSATAAFNSTVEQCQKQVHQSRLELSHNIKRIHQVGPEVVIVHIRACTYIHAAFSDT